MKEYKLFKNRKGHNMNMHIMIGLMVLGIMYYINLRYKWIEVPTDNLSIIKLVAVAILYSIVTDIDQQGAIINRYASLALVAVIIYSFYNKQYQQYGIIAALVLGIVHIVHHREIIHSVLGGIVIAAPLLYLGRIYFIVGLAAFITHIISDNDFSFGWEKDHRLRWFK